MVDTFPQVITTATGLAASTAFSNQRKLDRCQDGTLVYIPNWSDNGGRVHYSKDNGTTWVYNGLSIDGWSNGSIFIDLDDCLHAVWKQSGTLGGRTDGFIYYMRGTPSSDRTSWTFGSAVALWGNVNYNYPDLVVHREGTGWVGHAVVSYAAATGVYGAYYLPISISSGGVPTPGGQITLGQNYDAAVFAHTYPSVDFRHTGDSKTGHSAPDVYVAWSAGTTGAGKGIRFRRANYTGPGAWSWGAEREIDNTRHFSDGLSDWWGNCLFDGTRVIIVTHTTGTQSLAIYERDVADTTTTARILVTGTSYHFGGSATYDALGNVYIFYFSEGNALYANLTVRKWSRATGNLGAPLILDFASTRPYPSCRRGYAGGRIDWVYTVGNQNPYQVRYDRTVLSDFPSDGTYSSSPNATAFSNQRKLDRFSNGVLVRLEATGALSITSYMSTSSDGGKTWQYSGTEVAGANNSSIFVDQDDYVHVVWKQYDGSTGRVGQTIYYMRGTPNAGRTAFTWSTPIQVVGVTNHNYPDLVIFREGTGWAGFIVTTSYDGATGSFTYGYPVTITSGGVITVGAFVTLGGSYGTGAATYPSIDFNHTGDGKTVAGGTPHLYVAWSAGGTGAGKGLRFRKAVYSAGAWTWNTERELSNTQYVVNDSAWINCLFDGTRVLICGRTYTGSDSYFLCYERDAADTTTTVTTAALDNGTFFRYGSCTYDQMGNVYWIGTRYVVGDVCMRKWTRATNVTTLTQVDPQSGGLVSAKRGSSGLKIEWIYTAGSGPYDVRYSQYSLPFTQQNLAPDAVLAQTGMTGAYTDVDDSPDAPDANAMVGSGSWSVRYSFPSPSGQLAPGAGLQKFRVKLT